MKHIPKPPTPRLDVKDLRVVLALSSAGSTAHAASALSLTQPAVSRALLLAEEKLGLRIFERTPRGLTPTAAGERLLEGASKILLELKELERHVRAPVVSPTRLRLVCECYTAYHWLPSVLAALRATMPELEIAIGVEHTREPVAALVDGKVDIALVTTSIVPRAELEERPLFTDELVFVVGASHPLAAKKTLTPDDLRSSKLLLSHAPASEVDWFLRSVFGRARPRLDVARYPLTEAVIDVARAGMGIAIVSDWVFRPHAKPGELIVKRLTKGPLMRPWRLAWRREVGDAAQLLLSALQGTAPRAQLGGRTLGA